MSRFFRSPWFWFLITLLALVLLTFLGPEEKSLGQNVRIVYLHGAWVLAALAAFLAAGAAGLIGLLLRRDGLHRWSQALGRTGILFWITYLPLSLWAMQANWNGLFLSEPRFRLAVIFAGVGLLLQIGLAIMDRLPVTSAGNLLFALALAWSLQNTSSVLHPPPSPIFSSGIALIEIFFIAEILVALLAAWFATRGWLGK